MTVPHHIRVTDLGTIYGETLALPQCCWNWRRVNLGLHLFSQALPLRTSPISTSSISTSPISTSNPPSGAGENLYSSWRKPLDFLVSGLKRTFEVWFTFFFFLFLFLVHWNERDSDIRTAWMSLSSSKDFPEASLHISISEARYWGASNSEAAGWLQGTPPHHPPARGTLEVGETYAGDTQLYPVRSQHLRGSDQFSCTRLGKPLWKQVWPWVGGGGQKEHLGPAWGFSSPTVKILQTWWFCLGGSISIFLGAQKGD